MFRQFARMMQEANANKTPFDLHPVELAASLEAAWDQARVGGQFGFPGAASPNLGGFAFPGALPGGFFSSDPFEIRNRLHRWDHLIYAYMLENTRIYEIFRRVIKEFAHGERLGVAQAASRSWLRATEELFYYDTPPGLMSSLMSHVRPDMRASRRNAYYRMFGMDLNHGTDGGHPYAYEKPEAANREFVKVFEDLLREVWRAIENSGNTSGANPTDDTVLISLCRTLRNMLNSRRINGNLAREEFVFVATMSWLHLTIEYDSSVVRDLRAQATSPAERLRLVGERVGLASHAKSDSYFALAEAMSPILILIEDGRFQNEARTLYAPFGPGGAGANGIREKMATIITHWSLATGRPMKTPRVEVVGPAAPRPAVPAASVGSNGATPAAATDSVPAPTGVT